MSTKRGKKVQEALRGGRFTKSVVRVKLTPEAGSHLPESSSSGYHVGAPDPGEGG